MKPKSLSIVFPSLLFCASGVASHGQVLSVAAGAWDAAATWSDTAGPTSGKNYKIDGENVNSPNVPSGTATRTFAGSSLEISGGELQLKVEHSGGLTTGNYTIPGLSLTGGAMVFDASNGSTAWNLNSPINFNASTSSKLILRDGNFETSANIKDAITGSGNIAFEANRTDTDDDRANLNVQSANNTFSGNWSAQGFDTGSWANIRAGAANALGTGVVTLLDRGSLQLDVANGIDSLTGVTLSHSTSRLNLNGRAWTAPGAALTVTTGNVNAGSAVMSIASASQAGGSINLFLNASSNGKLITSGAATFTGGVVNASPTTNPSGKSYDIITYGSLVGTPVLSFGDIGRLTATVDNGSGTSDSVSVSFDNGAANLVWTGDDVGFENDWDKEIALNFSNGGTPDKFFTYDNVTFGNTTGSTTPNVIGNLVAGTVTFDHSTNDYTLGGTGSLTGGTVLVKAGTGKLNIINANTYTGTTTISGGILEVGNGGTTGTLGSGAVINDSQLVINRSDAVTLANAIGGSGSLSKSGANTLILTGNNTYSGATTIPAGTLQVGNAGTTGALGSGPVSNSGALVFNRTNNFTVGALISGNGTLTQAGTGTTTLTAANDYTGLTTISAGKLAFSGGNNRISTGGTVAFSATSGLDLGSVDQTLATLTFPVGNADSSTTITGSGTLTLNGAQPFNFGVSGTGITTTRTAAMNMTGLASFLFDAPTQLFRVGAQTGVSTSGSGVPNGSFLASNDTSITALSFLLADQAGTGTGGTQTFRMGEETSINANTINLGASGRSNATLNFNTGLTTPKATLRGTNGTSPVSTWEVGRVAHFSTNTWTATADFSAGELDAMVTTLRIGIANPTSQSNRAGVQNGAFIMGKGSLVATNLVVGEQSGTGTSNNTYTANGTFTLNHVDGTVTATSLRLAENTGSVTGGTRSVNGTFNLQAGKLIAGEIRRGNQTATSPAAITLNFNWSGGTIQNPASENLLISSVPITLTGTNNPTFEATSGRSITLASDSGISGAGFGFTKAGAGTLTLSGTNTFTGNTWLDAGILAGNGSAGSLITAADGTTLAPGSGVAVGTYAAAGVVLEPGATLAIEINSSTAAADQLVSTAAVDITGANVSFTEIGSGIIPSGTKLTLIDYTGSSLTGTFNSYAEGASVAVGANTFTLSYADSSKVTLTSTTVGSTFSSWISGFYPAETDPLIVGPQADPDGDGVANLVEYLTNGIPTSNADKGLLWVGTSGNQLVLSLAIRGASTTFSGSPSPATIVDGITAAIEGSLDLGSFSASVSGTSFVLPSGWSPTAPADHSYHSFKLDASAGLTGKGFLRLSATQP